MSDTMNLLFTVLIGVAALGALLVVFIGVFTMGRQGHDPRRSNKLMRWRVILQAVALALIAIFLLLAKR